MVRTRAQWKAKKKARAHAIKHSNGLADAGLAHHVNKFEQRINDIHRQMYAQQAEAAWTYQQRDENIKDAKTSTKRKTALKREAGKIRDDIVFNTVSLLAHSM